jgi:hypothetical protein
VVPEEDSRKPFHVVLVHGYGCNLDSPLTPYLLRVSDFLRLQRPDVVVTCGGATQRMSRPGKTEAGVMNDFLYDRLDSPMADWHPAWFVEEDSYTTLENVLNGSDLVRRLVRDWDARWETTTVTVFCETQRSLKTLLCYWLLLPELRRAHRRVQVETYSWELANPLLEIPKLFNELLMLYVPAWRRYLRSKRIAASEKR